MTALLRSSCQPTESRRLGLRPMLRWMGQPLSALIPVTSAMAQSATEKLLKRFDLKIDDIGLVELNEAFAAQAIGCMRQLGLSHDNTNVNGGAIALGHPTGCSGARI